MEDILSSAALPADVKAKVKGVLDGAEFEFNDWAGGTVLLDFLTQKGLKPPHSCRVGDCAACAYRVVSGDVVMLKSEGLAPEDVADGLSLACQSVPASREIVVSFDG
ncbi:2Fe-2S iron-sulfur cluster-binding protein [Paraburkholderia tropica]|uniref:2Fe-2S iron-sulfur cluster-binding protein n=1 Tax=Paraburkholderia tropica TaxID=92647 RepID=UPI0015917AB1|nr:2Fe-2S iron-sulfur cluster binding domain-containing protein [Paraburkholderia tropica]